MIFGCVHKLFWCVSVSVLLFLFGGCARDSEQHGRDFATDRAAEIRDLTGEATRIVWLQDTADGSDYLARRENLRLMGLDTEDDAGQKIILDGPRSMAKPFFTNDGEWIIFSDRHQQRIFAVHWEGRQLRDLGPGFALTSWLEPETGIEWLYVARDRLDDRRILPAYQSLFRFPLFAPGDDGPAREFSDQGAMQEELVWDQTQISEDSFQISPDGRFASAAFPWPEVGILDFAAGRWDRLGQGCWVAMSPDDEYLFWVFDGPHRNVTIFRTDREDRWTVNVNNAPGMDGYEVYHPRWSNHSRIIAVSGPYKIGEGAYRLPGGGTEVKIHLGRFNAERTEVEAWVQVTDNSHADFYPDVWVRPSPDRQLARKDLDRQGVARETMEGVRWPSNPDGLAYVWENASGLHDIEDVASGSQYIFRPEPRMLARYDRHHGMLLQGGYFVDKTVGQHFARFDPLMEFTVEFTATQSETQPPAEEAKVFALAGAKQTALAVVAVQGQWRLQASETDLVLESVMPGQPVHFALVSHSGKLDVFMDGQLEASAAITIAPDVWTEAVFLFGGDGTRNSDWHGTLEKFAVYQRPMNQEEIAANHALITAEFAQRAHPETMLVKAKVVQASAVPAPEEIAPYRRGLVVNEYEVIEVLDGELPEERFLAAHWAILDEALLDTAHRLPGSEHTMLLERFEDRKELEGERLAQDTDNFLLELYFDVNL